MKLKSLAASVLLAVSAFSAVAGEKITFSDPRGDDNGPGGYVYPTDAVYTRGSFDLTEFEVDYTDKKVTFNVSMDSKLDDPWGMGVGFAVQMVFVFIDTGDGGHTKGLPGLNIAFDEGSAWNKVVILSPQKKSRVTSEAKTKVPADMKGDVIVPSRTRGKSKTISASVKLEDLGGGDPSKWGYQVVVQSNEGFPAETDLLTRKVNEYEGQHRFGGGNDGDCDPHVVDILAGSGSGGDDEAKAQHDMLKYTCDDEGNTESLPKLKMVRKN
ncbi:MAG: glucodextranase DOMON-like domain-containing protein [Acidobacteriota bacterium]|nr:glucodextranase DOMON-like domain-containing protein [Acidobacteriota bacterium]